MKKLFLTLFMLPVTVFDVAGVSNISDGFGLMLQAPFSGSTSVHLTGEPAVGDDMINGYVSTVTTVLPFLRPLRVAGTATKGGTPILNAINTGQRTGSAAGVTFI